MGVGVVQNTLLATPDGAPSVPSIYVLAFHAPDMPSVSRVAYHVLNVSVDSEAELVLLDRVVLVGGTMCTCS